MLKVLVTVKLKEAKLVLAAFMVLLLLLTFFPGCVAPKAEPPHLKVLALPYLAFTTFYIPQEEGYFDEQGLEVEFVKFPSVTQAIPLLAGGGLDVVAGPLSASLINAVAQDMNLRIVAGRERAPSDCDSIALMVRRDLYDSGELDTTAEMKGRKVAISSTGTIMEFSLDRILKTAGLTVDDVEMVKMTPQDTYAAFENRAVAAAILGTPHNHQIEALGYAATLDSLNNLMPDFQQSFIVFGPSLLDDNPELGRKFMVAYLQGVRQYNQGKTKRNLEIIEKHLGMDEETLSQICLSPVYPDARIIIEDILTFQDWLYEEGLVDKKVTAEQLIDTRFVDYANEVLGPAP